MKRRFAGYILWALLVAPFLLVAAAVPVALLWAREDGLERVIRSMTMAVNAGIFDGSPYESTSSHAWRERDKAWAKAIIYITDLFQHGHCEGANKIEQPIIDMLEGKK